MVSSFLQRDTKQHHLQSWLCCHPLHTPVALGGFFSPVVCSEGVFDCPLTLRACGSPSKRGLTPKGKQAADRAMALSFQGLYSPYYLPGGFAGLLKHHLGAPASLPAAVCSRNGPWPLAHLPHPAQPTCKHREILPVPLARAQAGAGGSPGFAATRDPAVKAQSETLQRVNAAGVPLGKARVCRAGLGKAKCARILRGKITDGFFFFSPICLLLGYF